MDDKNYETESGILSEDGEVAVAELYGEDVAVTSSAKPRRTNAGAGVERIQMYHSGKDY